MGKILIAFPNVAKPRDGIADHSRTLGAELAKRGHDVGYVGRGDTGDSDLVGYMNGWPNHNLRDTSSLIAVLEQASAVVLQFEQFSYGYRGFNPGIARLFATLSKRAPWAGRITYFHETWAPPTSAKRAVMWAYQRHQARLLAADSHVVLHSCQVGYNRLHRANPASSVVPVHSNIPLAPSARRDYEGVDADRLVVLVFGHLEPSRAELIRLAFAAIQQQAPNATLWYVGRAGEAARALVPSSASLRVWPNADPKTVSGLMYRADMALAPFVDGVSGRRGSFAALLAHGVPSLTTEGRYTDQFLRTVAACGGFEMTTRDDFASRAAYLATRPTLREEMRRIALGASVYMPSVTASADAIENAMRRAEYLQGI